MAVCVVCEQLLTGLQRKFCSKVCNSRWRLKNAPAHINPSDAKLFMVWSSMVRRCAATTGHHAAYYRNRGISVCDEWREDFHAFQRWSRANGYREGLSIDRRKSSLGYSPDNCRWATRAQQCQNVSPHSDRLATPFKGVRKHGRRWVARIRNNRKDIGIGRFDTAEEAARAYDAKAAELFGEFASLNFPPSSN